MYAVWCIALASCYANQHPLLKAVTYQNAQSWWMTKNATLQIEYNTAGSVSCTASLLHMHSPVQQFSQNLMQSYKVMQHIPRVKNSTWPVGDSSKTVHESCKTVISLSTSCKRDEPQGLQLQKATSTLSKVQFVFVYGQFLQCWQPTPINVDIHRLRKVR